MNTKPTPIITSDVVLNFIAQAEFPISKRDLARGLKLRGADKIVLKQHLKTLVNEGKIERGTHRNYQMISATPKVTPVEITEITSAGDIIAKPLQWETKGEPPKILLDAPTAKRKKWHMLRGKKFLVRLKRLDDQSFLGIPITPLDRKTTAKEPFEETILGVYQETPRGRTVRLVSKKYRHDFPFEQGDGMDLKPGDLVVGQFSSPPTRGRATPRFSILKPIGHVERTSLSQIAIKEYQLPDQFAPETLHEAETLKPLDNKEIAKRRDLRAVPFVTIDGEDARDFDDAVWAEPHKNGGWHIRVAIADVSYYVRPGRPLDREARSRGNSVYFPDCVLPMLPEILSNNLCSLRPDEDKAVMVADMIVNQKGQLQHYEFYRAVIRSVARLTYTEVQQAFNQQSHPLLDNVINPLFAAFDCLHEERLVRGCLELNIPEKKVVLSQDGKISAIGVRERLPSHQLIEDFMILANRAAALTIEKNKHPGLYRVHDEPSAEKILALRVMLQDLKIPIPKRNDLTPADFNQILQDASQTVFTHLVNDMVLRSQAQAIYDSANIGHYGLGLSHYAHFTSPIRRYADLVVHRCLTKVLGLGEGGIPDPVNDEILHDLGVHVSYTERRAAKAEYETVDRYMAAYLENRTGETFQGRITGVTRFGLFVNLNGTAADGLIPIGSLAGDYYQFNEKHQSLVGMRTKRRFHVGDGVDVQLVDATAVSGTITLSLIDHRPIVASAKSTSLGKKSDHPKSFKKSRRRGRK